MINRLRATTLAAVQETALLSLEPDERLSRVLLKLLTRKRHTGEVMLRVVPVLPFRLRDVVLGNVCAQVKQDGRYLLNKHLTAFADADLDEITAPRVREWRAEWRAAGCSPRGGAYRFWARYRFMSGVIRSLSACPPVRLSVQLGQ